MALLAGPTRRFGAILLLFVLAAIATATAQSMSPGDFTVVALPDTQFYSSTYPQIFASQTQWIANNATQLNIQLVLGLGDIVDGGGVTTQWQNADAAMRILDGKVPYLMAMGNHDFDKNDPASRTASSHNFNTYFGPPRYAGQSWYQGNYPTGSNENFYGTFTINGRLGVFNPRRQPGLGGDPGDARIYVLGQHANVPLHLQLLPVFRRIERQRWPAIVGEIRQ
jgi:2',3'-cyclic-nucleotide 2'-phosphodiesterase (5'-nucleotidase family)